MKPVTPSIESISFSCPRCNAHADQFWYDVFAKEISDHGKPSRFDIDALARWDRNAPPENKTDELREALTEQAERISSNQVFLNNPADDSIWRTSRVGNLSISRCYSCQEVSVWIGKSIVHPVAAHEGPAPNEDLTQDIQRDFNEARVIVNLSPRGAAALLRLCVQKLCKELGQPGENINKDIASLVAEGLDARVQQALDIVRVIGNNAVHPGAIDLRDDPSTVAALFGLVNLIADQMISQPKRVAEIYNAIPASQRESIAKRDAPKR